MEQLSADLTRFDFHVNRFLGSQDVKQMTVEEVGQYILLLLEAWTLHKGASLPNDMNYLCMVARSKRISPRVMKKFVLVTMDGEDGPEQRLRNKRLFEEWNKALNRYQRYSRGARKTNEKRWGNESLGDSLGDSLSDSLSESPSERYPTAIPYHTNPTQSRPTQKDLERPSESRLKELEQLRKEMRDDE